MRSISCSLLRYAAVILLVTARRSVAQENNPISHPKPGEIITAGSQYKVVWTPTKGDIVSLVLFNNFAISPYFPGASCEAEENVPGCTEVFANKTNSGSFLWNVPVNAPESDTYYLDVYVPNPGPGGPFYFMTGNFSIRPGSTTSTTTDASSSIVNPNAATDLASATASLPSTSASGSHSTSTTKGDASLAGPQPVNGLSPGAIGGIVGGVLVGIGLGVAFAVLFFRFRRRKTELPVGTTDIPLQTSTSGRTYDNPFNDETKLAGNVAEIGLTEKETVGGRIRYPDPDEADSVISSGRLQSY